MLFYVIEMFVRLSEYYQNKYKIKVKLVRCRNIYKDERQFLEYDTYQRRVI